MATRNNASFETLFSDRAGRAGGLKVVIGKGGKLVVQRSEEIDEEPDPLTEAEIEEQKAQSYAQGETEGRLQAVSAHDQALGMALTRAGETMEGLFHHADAAIDNLRREAAELALIIAAKLAPALIAREPAAEIEALVTTCLETLKTETQILVRVEPQLRDEVEARLTGIAALRGFTGRLVVAVDETLSNGDVRVEWQGGGAERDREAILRDIDEVIQRHVGFGPGA